MLYLRTADRALYADLSAALAMARYLERRGCRQRRRHHRVATGDGVDRADLIRANAAHPGPAPVTRRMPAKVRIATLEAPPAGLARWPPRPLRSPSPLLPSRGCAGCSSRAARALTGGWELSVQHHRTRQSGRTETRERKGT